ncbi:hypothetical protein B9Z55_015704 [Caenorhabditis nigoni]|uniref:Uncharacterized protein n=1 Tax=Caenorhabditis nigoni TaxID=1611254 RepID=A0A2G5UBE7_9PELO|nr:hypothetical protein B9Z55_015704 [Caenorhabditis nigoni]
MGVLVLDLGHLQVNVLPVLVHASAESILRHGIQEIRYMTPLIKFLNRTTQTFLRVIENWKIRAIATKFAYPTQSLLKTMSLCIGLAMTVERWVAVCKPLEALARCTRKISIRMLKVITCGDCSAQLSINSGVEKIPATCGTTYNFVVFDYFPPL